MIVDRLSLRTAFEAYIKRQFADENFSTFLQLAQDRIFRDTRASENMINVALVPTSTLIDLPADYIDTREISYQNGSRRVVLRSIGRHVFGRSASLTGLPTVYSVVGRQVEVAPITLPTEFSLWYWQKLPQLVADDDTNIILTTYPYLYLYGLLIEGNVFIQDLQALELATGAYSTEVGQVNGAESRRRFGEAPVVGIG
jgi:hypothetical protein